MFKKMNFLLSLSSSFSLSLSFDVSLVVALAHLVFYFYKLHNSLNFSISIFGTKQFFLDPSFPFFLHFFQTPRPPPLPPLFLLSASLAPLALALPLSSLPSASSTSGSVAAIATAESTCQVECTKGRRGHRSSAKKATTAATPEQTWRRCAADRER
jgi:hypothetical protein